MSSENRRESNADGDAETETRSESSVCTELKRSVSLLFGITVVLFTTAIEIVQLLDTTVIVLDSGIRT
ncbi:hypothetical protein OB955_16870 [Halobacteria archaeon AArc-m2/3/4]|uniref:Uncharacterized protein n=1 Tax=Natronoglomus mannanivorans TaxID=2979990 RepID=A0ABT2QHI7_9EURY|nr:hypothetical protein [Halobacteria archaeon AArc-m2/3/4]